MMKSWLLVSLSVALLTACGGSDDVAEGEEPIASASQSLDSARTRVVQEASFAMTGSYTSYTYDNWPTVSTYAAYYYTLTDTGAWNLLLASSAYGPTSYYVSCMRTRAAGHIYTPCQLSTSTGFGSYEMPYYTCQGSCPSNRMRGGQCKPFMNLVAYRSGQYQDPNYAFRAFPNDGAISSWSTAADQMPYATYDNILPGDFLRMPNGHAAIVVRKIASTTVPPAAPNPKAVIFDSNWLDGDGNETVGSHVLGWTGSSYNNLGNYRVIKCAYNATKC